MAFLKTGRRGITCNVASEEVKTLPGAKTHNPKDFDPKALSDGIKEEMEHTTDRKAAEQIAMDHLAEDPQYYVKLKKVTVSGNLTKNTINRGRIQVTTNVWTDEAREAAIEARRANAKGPVEEHVTSVDKREAAIRQRYRELTAKGDSEKGKGEPIPKPPQDERAVREEELRAKFRKSGLSHKPKPKEREVEKDLVSIKGPNLGW